MAEKAKVQKLEACAAVHTNRRVPDFHCKILVAHSIHVDPRTGERWGAGDRPRGWNKRWELKRYANSKLHRASRLGNRTAQNTTTKKKDQ